MIMKLVVVSLLRLVMLLRKISYDDLQKFIRNKNSHLLRMSLDSRIQFFTQMIQLFSKYI